MATADWHSTALPKLNVGNIKNYLLKHRHDKVHRPHEPVPGKELPKVVAVTEKQDDINSKTQDLCSLEGLWYNQHGSELKIAKHEDGTIHGEYRTSIETSSGASGNNPTPIKGTASHAGKTLGFSASWNDGESVTSWAGQCVVCDGEEKLLTTWVLTSSVDTCKDSWMANRIGQDTFRRAAIGY